MTSSHGQRDQSFRCCNAASSAQTFPSPCLVSLTHTLPSRQPGRPISALSLVLQEPAAISGHIVGYLDKSHIGPTDRRRKTRWEPVRGSFYTSPRRKQTTFRLVGQKLERVK